MPKVLNRAVILLLVLVPSLLPFAPQLTGVALSGPESVGPRAILGSSPVSTVTGGSAPGGNDSQVAPPPRLIKIKIEGTLSQVDKADLDGRYLVVLADTPVLVTEETVIEPEKKLAPGDMVIVNATLEGETPVATYILIRNDATNQIEFRGEILSLPESLSAGQDVEWVVGGKDVEVSRAVVIGQPIVGHYAHVTGWLQAYGRVRATHIRIWDPAEIAARFEFEGIIEDIPGVPGNWTIGGVRGQVDARTLITGEPAVGDVVEVRGRRLGEHAFAFDYIRVLDEGDREIRVSGIISEIEIDTSDGLAGHLVVGHDRFEIDGMTFIDESQGRARPGMWAEVTARRGLGGVLYALRIRVERPE